MRTLLAHVRANSAIASLAVLSRSLPLSIAPRFRRSPSVPCSTPLLPCRARGTPIATVVPELRPRPPRTASAREARRTILTPGIATCAWGSRSYAAADARIVVCAARGARGVAKRRPCGCARGFFCAGASRWASIPTCADRPGTYWHLGCTVTAAVGWHFGGVVQGACIPSRTSIAFALGQACNAPENTNEKCKLLLAADWSRPRWPCAAGLDGKSICVRIRPQTYAAAEAPGCRRLPCSARPGHLGPEQNTAAVWRHRAPSGLCLRLCVSSLCRQNCACGFVT